MHKSSSSGCHSHTKRKKRRVAHQPKLCPTESKSCEFGKDSFGVFISFWLTNHRSYPPRLELVKPWNRIKYLLPQQTLSSCTSYRRRKERKADRGNGHKESKVLLTGWMGGRKGDQEPGETFPLVDSARLLGVGSSTFQGITCSSRTSVDRSGVPAKEPRKDGTERRRGLQWDSRGRRETKMKEFCLPPNWRDNNRRCRPP
jgi:hypothetical protein